MPGQTVIIHDLLQARTAVGFAISADVKMELRSPPGGGKNIGPGIFKAIVDELEKIYPNNPIVMILDCGSDPGFAMAALRRGCRDICIDVSDEVGVKIKAIATALSANIHERNKLELDLGSIRGTTKSDINAIKSLLNTHFHRGQ